MQTEERQAGHATAIKKWIVRGMNGFGLEVRKDDSQSGGLQIAYNEAVGNDYLDILTDGNGHATRAEALRMAVYLERTHAEWYARYGEADDLLWFRKGFLDCHDSASGLWELIGFLRTCGGFAILPACECSGCLENVVS